MWIKVTLLYRTSHPGIAIASRNNSTAFCADSPCVMICGSHGDMNVFCGIQHQKYVESGRETRFAMSIARGGLWKLLPNLD